MYCSNPTTSSFISMFCASLNFHFPKLLVIFVYPLYDVWVCMSMWCEYFLWIRHIKPRQENISFILSVPKYTRLYSYFTMCCWDTKASTQFIPHSQQNTFLLNWIIDQFQSPLFSKAFRSFARQSGGAVNSAQSFTNFKFHLKKYVRFTRVRFSWDNLCESI